MTEEEELKDEYARYTDESLRDILYKCPGDYELHALESALEELEKRFEPILSKSSDSTIPLVYIVETTTFDQISEIVREVRRKDARMDDYADAFDKIKGIKPDPDTLFLLSFDEDRRYPDETHVHGQMLGSDEIVDVTLLTWKEWLAASVPKEQLLQYGVARIVALSLVDMTVSGFNEVDTENRLAEIESYCNPEAELEADKDIEEESFFTLPRGDGMLADLMLRLKTEKKKKSDPQIRPWVRFFARSIDFFLFTTGMNYLLFLVSPGTYRLFRAIPYINLALVLLIPVEAVLLSTIGTTPGKWLLKVRVRAEDGKLPSFKTALLRSALVIFVGSGCGVPLLNLVLFFISFNRLESSGSTFWDDKAGTGVSHEKIETWRYIVAVFILVVIPLFEVMIIMYCFRVDR